MTRQIGKLIATDSQAAASVFEVTNDDAVDTYYFCCESCGACGKHHLGYSTASDEANTHITEFH